MPSQSALRAEVIVNDVGVFEFSNKSSKNFHRLYFWNKNRFPAFNRITSNFHIRDYIVG